MRSPILWLLPLLLVSACARFASPDVSISEGSKGVIGSIKVEGYEGPNGSPVPTSLFMGISKVTLKPGPDGKLIGEIGTWESTYVLKSVWQSSKLPDSLPFFISMKPGLYVIKSLRFGYPYSPPVEFKLSLGRGLPLEVAAGADATYIGRMVITIDNVQNQFYSANMNARIESEPETRAMFLQHHPGLTMKEILLPLKNASPTVPLSGVPEVPSITILPLGEQHGHGLTANETGSGETLKLDPHL